MKCPKCNYIDCDSENNWEDGEKGSFYRLPIDMVRPADWGDKQERSICGCPVCGTIFLDL